MTLIIGFILGILSSAIVGGVVYARQKKESAESERRLVKLLERQLETAGHMATTVMVVRGRQNHLLEEFYSLREQLSQVMLPSGEALAEEHQFPELAGVIAEAGVRPLLRRAPLSATLSPDVLRSLHKELFPKGHPAAGELRDVNVWVGPPGSTPEDARYIPPSPAEVPQLTEDLLHWWTVRYSELRGSSEVEMIEALALFHHRFVSIHPFLDGNGTVARLLLSMQWRDLTGEVLDIELKREEYFDTLRAADGGDMIPLNQLLQRALGREY